MIGSEDKSLTPILFELKHCSTVIVFILQYINKLNLSGQLGDTMADGLQSVGISRNIKPSEYFLGMA